jgi:hypothetical protein
MKRVLLSTAILLGTALTGCAGGYVVQVGPPPPPRYGVMGYAPGPGYVWTDGYWDWRGGRWVWMSGAWLRPPRPHAVWVPGGWIGQERHMRFRRGYWR